MTKAEYATNYAEAIAKDDRHGYDQNDRWGNPNYDCSGLVIDSYDKAGTNVKKLGASYTGNMYKAFIKAGFTDVTKSVNIKNASGMKRGDVLLKPNSHTALYCGNQKIVHASINEKGKTTGGKSGDQTGKEICIRSYYNKPWTYVLRYVENETTNVVESEDYDMPILKKGKKGTAVKIWQCIIGVDIDGSFGPNTDKVTREWQTKHGLEADGSVGPKTWKEGLNSVK